ncbi:MAG: acyl-CoA synthetase [Haloglomus sp.]
MESGTTRRRLEAYRFYEREWEDYRTLREEFEWDVPNQFNIAAYVCDRWAERQGERVALVCETQEGTSEYTFTDLQRRANRFANYLRTQGVERGDRVAVNGSQRVEVLATHLACWKLGAVSIPLSVLFGPDALGYRLEDSAATAVVATAGGLESFREVRGGLSSLETSVIVDVEPEEEETTFAAAVEGHSDEFETVDTAAEDPSTIIYTSGTTGEPKGVVLPHRHLLGILPSAVCSLFNMEIRDDDVLRTPVEWSWAGSIIDLVEPALYYGMTVLAADLGPFDPETELELLERHDVTVTGGPPTAYRVALNHPAVDSADLSAIRMLGLGGEAAGDALIERARELLPDAAIHEVYGQSEAPLFAGDCEALGIDHRSGKMGRPGPGHEVRVVDPDTGDPVETGEVGEFELRREGNPVCFTEYWNKPDRTARKVADGWQRCEDLGSVDAAGYLSFHSRKDDIIISSGYKVSPASVEDALSSHEAVLNVGVIGIPDETRGELVKAFVALTEGHEPTEDLREELQEFVRRRLAKHEYPRELEFVGELPKTTTGKVRRRDLRAREGLVEGD